MPAEPLPEAPGQDVLEGARQPGGDSRRSVAAVLVVLVLLAAVVSADRWQQRRELDALLDAVEAAEPVIAASQESLRSLAEYQAALLTGADVPDRARAAAIANLAADARRWTPQLADEQQRVAAVGVLPWHGDLERAREAYGRRVQGWVDVLARTQAPPRRDGNDMAGASSARTDALAALLDVAGDEDARVRAAMP